MCKYKIYETILNIYIIRLLRYCIRTKGNNIDWLINHQEQSKVKRYRFLLFLIWFLFWKKMFEKNPLWIRIKTKRMSKIKKASCLTFIYQAQFLFFFLYPVVSWSPATSRSGTTTASASATAAAAASAADQNQKEQQLTGARVLPSQRK